MPNRLARGALGLFALVGVVSCDVAPDDWYIRPDGGGDAGRSDGARDTAISTADGQVAAGVDAATAPIADAGTAVPPVQDAAVVPVVDTGTMPPPVVDAGAIDVAPPAIVPCPQGTLAAGDGTCKDIDECLTGNGGCSGDATCTNTPGSRTCACKAGFSGNGITCADINECATGNGGCAADATCTNSAGSRACACKTGFSGDGINCADVDECATGNGGCAADATCTNSAGSRACACKTGFSGDGINCADVDECATGNGGCAADATCTNSAGSRACACKTGFSGDGITCTPIPLTVTWTNDAKPIFAAKCGPCHTTGASGGHSLGATYAEAQLPSNACAGKTKAACTIVRIKNGSMPAGKGCSGDPATDAANASCLTAAEQAKIQAWIDGGALE